MMILSKNKTEIPLQEQTSRLKQWEKEESLRKKIK
jgi:hypothetical protein